jgi:hypothetical protein
MRRKNRRERNSMRGRCVYVCVCVLCTSILCLCVHCVCLILYVSALNCVCVVPVNPLREGHYLSHQDRHPHLYVQRSTVQFGAVRCSAVQCSTVQYSAVQCSAV